MRESLGVHVCRRATRCAVASLLVVLMCAAATQGLALRASMISTTWRLNTRFHARMRAVTEDEWKSVLSEDEYRILRKRETELPGFSEYTPGQLEFELVKKIGTKYPADGGYRCVGCDALIFYARSKISTRSGWPAFYDAAPLNNSNRPGGSAVTQRAEDGGSHRIEAVCTACGGHLGHVFAGEGWGTPTDLRYCVNGACLDYDSSVEQPPSLKQIPHLTLPAIPP